MDKPKAEEHTNPPGPQCWKELKRGLKNRIKSLQKRNKQIKDLKFRLESSQAEIKRLKEENEDLKDRKKTAFEILGKEIEKTKTLRELNGELVEVVNELFKMPSQFNIPVDLVSKAGKVKAKAEGRDNARIK